MTGGRSDRGELFETFWSFSFLNSGINIISSSMEFHPDRNRISDWHDLDRCKAGFRWQCDAPSGKFSAAKGRSRQSGNDGGFWILFLYQGKAEKVAALLADDNTVLAVVTENLYG